jgi:hypothetical protein
LVPVPAPVPVPDPVTGSGSRQYVAQFSKNTKIAQNLAFSMSEAANFPESLPVNFDFLKLNFMLNPD